jgi:hypothetical protein
MPAAKEQREGEERVSRGSERREREGRTRSTSNEEDVVVFFRTRGEAYPSKTSQYRSFATNKGRKAEDGERKRTMRTFDADVAGSGTVLRRTLALDVSGELLGDALVDAKDEAEFLRVAGGLVGNVRDRERVRLAVKVRATKEIKAP